MFAVSITGRDAVSLNKLCLQTLSEYHRNVFHAYVSLKHVIDISAFSNTQFFYQIEEVLLS